MTLSEGLRVSVGIGRRSTMKSPLAKIQVREGICRLDRLQPILPHYLTIEPSQVALHPEALAVLMATIRALFGAPPDEDFLTMQELLKETLPADARPA